jgi:phosphogluconate dehydratase
MINRPLGSDRMSCANLAHAIAVLSKKDKINIIIEKKPHIDIVTAYNEMLSAHQPYATYPALLRDETYKSQSFFGRVTSGP